MGGCAGLAAVGLHLLRRRFPALASQEINDVAGVAIGVLAAVYGIILGFVIVALYQDFTDAETNVQSEASQLIQLYEDTRGMPIADRIEEELRTYVANVRYREFPRMKEGLRYEQLGSRHVGDMYEVLRSHSPKGRAIVIAVAVLTSFNLLIAVVLNHPFSGDVSVSSDAFAQDRLAELHATPADADDR